ncbi:septum site-determining protein MinC [Effusibacillus dendaii]|uniref:Probable septum site-determining protein MinC n=1 Tax=Effusibacillus dendaii TaxID=2743772 RepID=A0A7I8D4T7_9BACL|nr:septum site-determining protein MinC [Effusibacillus dendaii]BCJ85077.1 septum site-determining protein MinC [Effusibacillus dendaii]
MQDQPGCEMPRTVKQAVTIKGIRDGLVFLFDDQCSFAEILEDLQEKLHGAQSQLLSGPIIRVTIETGRRVFDEVQKEQIRQLLSIYGNLVIQGFHSVLEEEFPKPPHVFLHRGTVRSGQSIEFDGDITIIGDVNPGGQVLATGDIYVMGALRGIAHAGCRGNEQAVIGAVYFQPTQLRIGSVISRSPDTSDIRSEAAEMEFAYLRNGQMAVEKMFNLYSIRLKK